MASAYMGAQHAPMPKAGFSPVNFSFPSKLAEAIRTASANRPKGWASEMTADFWVRKLRGKVTLPEDLLTKPTRNGKGK